MRIGIVGMGYVGLPLAVAFAEADCDVVGIDVDPGKIGGLREGRSHIEDIPDDRLAGVLHRCHFSTRYVELHETDAILVCVPTPLTRNREPDLAPLLGSAQALAGVIRNGQVVVLESTTFPGTTREHLVPLLEESGLRAGTDFALAFSPERVDPGNARYNTRNTPKIIGGMTAACTQVAKALYARAIDNVIPVSSTQTAEMVKLLENTFRSVNIGLVNEVALMCDRLGVDVWEVIEAAASKPFGFMPFYPGPGLGGHCIPIDPLYLSWKMKTLNYRARFIELAGEVNSGMPDYVCEVVANALNDREKSVKGSRLLVLGVTYKKDIEDVRESPALDIIKILEGKGARVGYNDPYVPSLQLDHTAMRSQDLLPSVRASDLVVIVTDHSSYPYREIVEAAPVIVDTRNATKGIRSPKIVKI
jgi:UDP-N-acetyl-D-glucosamine dehydrogenase